MGVFKKLAEVQAVIEQPKFDSTNPHFKSKFASLSECNRVVMDAVRKVGGCAVYQKSCMTDDGHGVVTTYICDEGGDLELSEVPYSLDSNPQKQGSGITYARRYSLCSAFCLVADEDDDGNAASAPARKSQPKRQKKEVGKKDMERFIDLREQVRVKLMSGGTTHEVDTWLGTLFGTTDEGKLDVAKMSQMLEVMEQSLTAGVLLESA